jgi:hypothetical protein
LQSKPTHSKLVKKEKVYCARVSTLAKLLVHPNTSSKSYRKFAFDGEESVQNPFAIQTQPNKSEIPVEFRLTMIMRWCPDFYVHHRAFIHN